jgi:hypothetical protein
MRNRKYVIGALVVSGTASAGVPTGQTLNAQVLPSKLSKTTFGRATIHNIIATTYSDFSASPAAKETKFTLDKDIKFVNGNTPACSLTTLQGATTTTAVQSQCAASVVGSGTDTVNNGAAPFTQPNPVMLVSGGGTTLYVWTRIAGGLTLVLNGQYAKGPNTLDVTGLPNTPGTDLTNFDTTFLKKKTGKSSYYVMARCRKGKLVSSETTTFYNGQSITASSKQKCKGVA